MESKIDEAKRLLVQEFTAEHERLRSEPPLSGKPMTAQRVRELQYSYSHLIRLAKAVQAVEAIFPQPRAWRE